MLFRERGHAEALQKLIAAQARKLGRGVKIMHVCGTHEDTISRHGLRSLLPNNVSVVPGPGCPVCITPPNEIEEAATLAESEVILTTYGDMFRVPGAGRSLADVKASGGDVRVVYSIHDSLELAKQTSKEVVHFAIGFETTAPSTASCVLEASEEGIENFSVLVAHRLIPPAMGFLLSAGDVRIDAFICPGHVSTVIGSNAYLSLSERYRVPQVVSGFEPIDVLLAIYILLRMLNSQQWGVANEYRRAVRPEGNVKAKELMREVFREVDVEWRGFPKIKASGLELKGEFDDFDARLKFGVRVESKRYEHFFKGCRCGDILKGKISPQECELFAKACRPERPIGPCMVSCEGACAIAYKYRGPTSH